MRDGRTSIFTGILSFIRYTSFARALLSNVFSTPNTNWENAICIVVEPVANQKLENLQLAAARLESGKSFDPTPRDSQSPSICQVFVKNAPDQLLSEDSEGASETATNSRVDQDLEIWLGGRDSNPDNVVQSHVSYRWTTSQYQPA